MIFPEIIRLFDVSGVYYVCYIFAVVIYIVCDISVLLLKAVYTIF